MMDKSDVVRAYQSLTRELLVKRALRLLSVDDQAEIAERLDALWRRLEADQQQAIEDWLKVELQPLPDSKLHEAASEVGVEAVDITVAPRSAA
jgi:hypothetical protein